MTEGIGLLEAAKLLLLPAAGFIAGFAAQWFLQARKSRDELARALASERAAALRQLWEITSLPPQIAALQPQASVAASFCKDLDIAIVDWYAPQGGALFLSWSAAQCLFNMQDRLRSGTLAKADLESAVSALRTRLKLDCGMYTRRESGRKLIRPRRAPWAGEAAADVSPPGEAG